MKNATLSQEHGFLINLTRSAYSYGVSLYRLDTILTGLGGTLGLITDITGSGNRAEMIFESEAEEQQYSYSLKLPPANPDLTKLVLLQELTDRIQTGDMSLEAGNARIAEIEKLPARYGPLLNALSFGLIGAAVAVIFAPPWIDVILGGVLGVVVYGIVMLAVRRPWVANTLEILSAFVAAVLATGMASLFPGSNPFVLVICAVAVFIPGFTLIMGLNELLFHHTVSGLNRLVDGIVITVKLFAGALLGGAIASLFLTIPAPAPPVAVPPLCRGYSLPPSTSALPFSSRCVSKISGG